MRGGHDQDQVRHRVRVARGMRHRHHAAIRRADRHDGSQPEVTPQRLHVLDILVERVSGGVALGRPAIAAMVEIDQLHPVRECAHRRLVAGVVAARTAVDQEGHGLFPHARPVGRQAHALDVEVDLGAP